MQKTVIGILIGFALASTIVMAEQATDKGSHHSMMGGMMQGMMGEQKSAEGSSMQKMMGMMMKMMEQCGQMMGSKLEPKHEEPNK